jgi:hypothetical protein
MSDEQPSNDTPPAQPPAPPPAPRLEKPPAMEMRNFAERGLTGSGAIRREQSAETKPAPPPPPAPKVDKPPAIEERGV